MTINGKIEAMKAIRSLKVELIESTLQSGHTVQRVMVGSLRDVKDIVEGIIEFAQSAQQESIIEDRMRTVQNELHEAHADIMNLRMALNEEKERNTRLMARLQSIHTALED